MVDENLNLEYPHLKDDVAEKENAYYELLGGDYAKCGNEWDLCNLIGISWKGLNDQNAEFVRKSTAERERMVAERNKQIDEDLKNAYRHHF